MITELKDTTAAEIGAALLAARRNLGASNGLVFTLIVATDSGHYADVLSAALEAGREHPSRIIIVTQGRAHSSQVSAELRTGGEIPGDLVTLRLSGEAYEHAESVVLPLLLPDSPVVVWWPHQSPTHPEKDPIGALADRRITDAAGDPDPIAALAVRAVNHSPGDTDLTWTRLTQWRALLAAALDQYPARIKSATVEGAADNAPAELMAAWLAARLKVPVEVTHSKGPGMTGVRLATAAGDIFVERADGTTARYAVPGQPQRSIALKRRTLNELITEELRRMDADDIFEQASEELIRRSKKSKPRRPSTSHAVKGGTVDVKPLPEKSKASKAAVKKAPAKKTPAEQVGKKEPTP